MVQTVDGDFVWTGIYEIVGNIVWTGIYGIVWICGNEYFVWTGSCGDGRWIKNLIRSVDKKLIKSLADAGLFLFSESEFSFIVLDDIVNEEKQMLFGILVELFDVLDTF